MELSTPRSITCTRRIQFCSGHRVHQHESKCAHLHGHNYVAFITARAPSLDRIGRIVDFSVLKERVGGWIDDNWDHGFILYSHDFEAIEAVASVSQGDTKQKLYLMDANPTAENMAEHLLRNVCPILFKDTPIEVQHVRLWETENCYAEANL